MLRLKKCAPRAGEARLHFLRFLPRDFVSWKCQPRYRKQIR